MSTLSTINKNHMSVHIQTIPVQDIKNMIIVHILYTLHFYLISLYILWIVNFLFHNNNC